MTYYREVDAIVDAYLKRQSPHYVVGVLSAWIGTILQHYVDADEARGILVAMRKGVNDEA